MSGTATLKFFLSAVANGAAIKLTPGTQDVVIAGDHWLGNIQEIGTAAENLVQGDVGTPGYIIAHNLNDTNFIEIGYDDGGFKPVVKLLPGEWALFRSAQATPQAKADTAACDLEFIMLEA